MDSLSMIQQKVSTLEDVVDQISENINHGAKHYESATRLLKKGSTTVSPRLSTCTPRSSVEIHTRKSPLQPIKKTESWEDSTFLRTKSSVDPMVRINKNPVKGMQKSGPASFANFRQVENSVCRVIKGYLSQGDLDSAYVEAMNSGDETVLVDLLDKTGPVLECLSNRTANDVLTTLAGFLSEQQLMGSIIPWLQQAVDLSSSHGPNNLVLTAKARRRFLGAIQEAVQMEFPNVTERRSITQLVSRLHQA
ncbi:TORTIFOLIA1-like protein 2 [Bidens hawaiensis]|uniref:TORTIFOLIA1-like protein 2 n=1 Tax=Bidens hawaiensis TaxID=980011 RepID=UPI00404B69FC